MNDFLFGGSPDSNSCGRSLDLALRMCSLLGFPVMTEKVFGPSTSLEFLGFLLDTIAMEIRLPVVKLQQLKHLLNSWVSRKSCSKRELLSLIGSLQHATATRSGQSEAKVHINTVDDLCKLYDGHTFCNPKSLPNVTTIRAMLACITYDLPPTRGLFKF